MNPAQRKPRVLPLVVIGALALAAVSGLLCWYLGAPQDPALAENGREAVHAPPQATEIIRPQDSHRKSSETKEEYHQPSPVKMTEVERKASTEILSGLQQDLKAIEIANAEVIHHSDDEFTQQTFIQIFPPEPKQLSAAWERFTQRLTEKNLRSAIAQEVWSRAQKIETDYTGPQDLPFRVIHSSRFKLAKGAKARFSISSYAQKPDIRFTDNGMPFVSSDGGAGLLQAPDLGKEGNRERYGHLLPLMPEFSGSDVSQGEK